MSRALKRSVFSRLNNGLNTTPHATHATQSATSQFQPATVAGAESTVVGSSTVLPTSANVFLREVRGPNQHDSSEARLCANSSDATTVHPVGDLRVLECVNPSGTGSSDRLMTQKLLRQEQYLKQLERFLDERCEFNQSSLVDYDIVREAWYQYIRDHQSEISKIDCHMRFSPRDVVLLDPRFQYRRIYFCRGCSQRHYSKCCEGYRKGHRFTRYGMVGLALKPIDEDEDKDEDKDEEQYVSMCA